MDDKTKFRERYAALQKTYEARLQSLGERFEAAIRQLGADESLSLLQENEISKDFVGQRIHELITHALTDEKEHFIKVLSDKLSKKEFQYNSVVREKQLLLNQKNSILNEMNQVASHIEVLQERYNAISNDTIEKEMKMDRIQQENQVLIEEIAKKDEILVKSEQEKEKFYEIQQDYIRLQAINSKDQVYFTQTNETQLKTIQDLTMKLEKVEMERSRLATEWTQLSLNVQEKSIACTHAKDSIDGLLSKLQRLESVEGQLAVQTSQYQHKLHEMEMENSELKRKYEAVGEQVEGLMKEQDEEKELMIANHSKQVDAFKIEINQLEKTRVDERLQYKKQHESIENQVKQYDGKLRIALNRLQEMEQKLAAAEVAKTELKMQSTKRIASLEQEIAAVSKEGIVALEKERQLRESTQDQFSSYKRMAELKISSLTATLQAQKDAARREVDAEKRIKWQEEAMKKHERLMEQMKQKYEASMTALQNQVVAARSQATNVANELHQRTSRHEMEILQQQHESKIAEAAKHVPGHFVPLNQHQAEVDKIEAKLTLKLQSQHQEEKMKWEEKLEKMLQDKANAMENEIHRWENALALEKRKADECHAALVHERKELHDCRESLEEANTSKQLVIQRLEEANLHITRFRQIVNEQQQALKKNDTKLAQLQKCYDEGRTQNARLSLDVANAQEEARTASQKHAEAQNTVEQLRQEILAQKTLGMERDVAHQTLLDEKINTIGYLQKCLTDSKASEIEMMQSIRQGDATRQDKWANQLKEWQSKYEALQSEREVLHEDHLQAMEAIKLHIHQFETIQTALDASREENKQLKVKKAQYKEALHRQKDSLVAAVQAQDDWKQTIAVSERSKMQQRFTLLEKLQNQLHQLKAEYKATIHVVKQLFGQYPQYFNDMQHQISLKMDKILLQVEATASQKLAEAKESWSRAAQGDIKAVEIRQSKTVQEQLQAQKSEYQNLLKVQKHQANEALTRLQDKLAEKEKLIEQHVLEIQQQTSDTKSLEQQLSFYQQDGSREIEQCKLQLVERDRKLHEMQTQLKSTEKSIKSCQEQLQLEKQRHGIVWDAFVRIGHAIMKHHTETWEFPESISILKKSIHIWCNQILQAVQTNQDHALSAAVQPFKEELLRAPGVLGRRDSGELSRSVLAMATPIAEELAAAKESIELLKREAEEFKAELTRTKETAELLDENCKQLHDEKNQLELFLNMAQQELKSAQAHCSTRVQDAYVQSDEAIHELKTAWNTETIRLKQEHRNQVEEIQMELETEVKKARKLEKLIVEQERQFTEQIKDLMKRIHVLTKQQSLREEPRRAPLVHKDERPIRQHRLNNSATSSMHDLSLLMEQNLKASRQEFQTKMLRQDKKH